MTTKIQKTDEEWKALLKDKGAELLAYEVTRHEATERLHRQARRQQGRWDIQLHLLRQAPV
jgi:hypothetical protein